MKVIGAGFPRTGTMSTQAALIRLGYRCYHMQEVPRQPGHLDAWNNTVHDKAPMDWRALFADYDATVDGPACFYYRELMEEFPEAKVLLNVRDPDRWFDSVATLMRAMNNARTLGLVVPRFKHFMRLTDGLATEFLHDAQERGPFVDAFNAHIDDVRRTVPPERLLVFEVSEGWKPLCEFLGREVPSDEPFPHLNEGDRTLKERIRRVFGRGTTDAA